MYARHALDALRRIVVNPPHACMDGMHAQTNATPNDRTTTHTPFALHCATAFQCLHASRACIQPRIRTTHARTHCRHSNITCTPTNMHDTTCTQPTNFLTYITCITHVARYIAPTHAYTRVLYVCTLGLHCMLAFHTRVHTYMAPTQYIHEPHYITLRIYMHPRHT